MRWVATLAPMLLAVACGSSNPSFPAADASAPDSQGTPVPDGSSPADTSTAPDAGPDGGDVIQQLLALTSGCANNLGGDYKAKSDPSSPANIPICGLNGAIYFNADMDIDCDGIESTTCNAQTDPSYQGQTSAMDSMGNWLDATVTPYVVIPLPSSRWDYTMADVHLGSVAIVIYNGQMAYGIFGDEGPQDIIGESSVAMANLLGIDSDPATGGVDTGVTYIVFTGSSGVVTKNEDHAEATTVGQARLMDLLKNN